MWLKLRQLSIVVDVVRGKLLLLLSIVDINNRFRYILVTHIWFWFCQWLLLLWLLLPLLFLLCLYQLWLFGYCVWCRNKIGGAGFFFCFCCWNKIGGTRLFFCFCCCPCCIVAEIVVVLFIRIVAIEIVDLVSILFEMINYLWSK